MRHEKPPVINKPLRPTKKHLTKCGVGFTLLPGEHEAVRMATALMDLGIYVVAFSYPVVPMGKARIRVQICASHSEADIDTCVQAFITARTR